MLAKLSRIFHTLRYLKPTQLVYFVRRRLMPAAKVHFEHSRIAASLEARSDFKLDNSLPIVGIGPGGNTFRFLNTTKIFSNECVEWTPNDASRLWRYNLHYFDYLREEGRSETNKTHLMNSWITGNPQGSQPGWEPFTVSLRTVNWVIYLCANPGAASPEILQSLYTQALWLEKNDERHILANHYFENLKALLFCGLYFEGDMPSRWRERATKELVTQLDEQTLPDGGHYERSPQYHCLMLENYLDIYNLVSNNCQYFSEDFLRKFHTAAEVGLDFIYNIIFPDQQIPLFNDSAFASAPSVAELEAYARRLFDFQSATKTNALHIIEKADSGLYGLRCSDDMLLMDAGDIGPTYQPGHTHCDFLSYELMLGGHRLVVDTGVCEYEPGQRRQYLRSTRAHNTVSVDGLEQSEVWGEFRVARRAQKIAGAAAMAGEPGGAIISGAYAGFFAGSYRDRPHFQHERQISVKLVKEAIESLQVVDTITNLYTSKIEHALKSYVHFHPEVELQDSGSGSIALFLPGGAQAELIIPAGHNYSLEETIYCPEFGLIQKNHCVVIECLAILPYSMSYCLRRISP